MPCVERLAIRCCNVERCHLVEREAERFSVTQIVTKKECVEVICIKCTVDVLAASVWPFPMESVLQSLCGWREQNTEENGI